MRKLLIICPKTRLEPVEWRFGALSARGRLRVCENISRPPALGAGEVVFGVITAARGALWSSGGG